MRIVIVGGVAGGASAATRLRRLDETSEIIILERGEFISYASCGLPYFIGDTITEQDALIIKTPEGLAKEYNIDVRTQNEVLSVNPAQKTVLVKNHKEGLEYVLEYDKLLLAPGAQPVMPPFARLNSHERIFSLRTVGDGVKIKHFIEQYSPKTAVIIGAGFVGLEMVENLTKQGLKVHVVEILDYILPPFDAEMSQALHPHLEEHGVQLHLGSTVESITAEKNHLLVQFTGGAIAADMVLVSVGVRPDTDFLRSSAITLNSKGAIVVNEQMKTSDAHIYAVGDATEITHFITGEATQLALAGPANRQGRIAADNIMGIHSTYKGAQGSSIIKVFDMTAASTGLNELAVKLLGTPYEKVLLTSPSHAGYYPGVENMFIKLLFSINDGKILGVQIVGHEGVDKRCDIIASAIRANMTVTELADLELCYAPPYSSPKDPVNMLGYVAENIIASKMLQISWSNYLSLPKNDDHILLDVRPEVVYHANPHVEGCTYIPISDLRKRMHELDKSKTIYIYCQIGLKSYSAYRILTQNGYHCYSISGGYSMYKLTHPSLK